MSHQDGSLGRPSSMLGIIAAVAEAVSNKDAESSHFQSGFSTESSMMLQSTIPSSKPSSIPSAVLSSTSSMPPLTPSSSFSTHSTLLPAPPASRASSSSTASSTPASSPNKRPKLVLPDLTQEIQEDVESNSSARRDEHCGMSRDDGSEHGNDNGCGSGEDVGNGDMYEKGDKDKKGGGKGDRSDKQKSERRRGGSSGKLPLFVTKRPEWADYPLKDIVGPPHSNDVLCGRGGGSNNHPGNESFRELVNEVKVPYVNCPKREKPLIARRIVEAVRNQTPPGRFLQKDAETGLWNDIGDARAREKTSQALREGAPIIRDMLQNDPGGEVNGEVVAAIKEAKKVERDRGEKNFDGGKERGERHLPERKGSMNMMPMNGVSNVSSNMALKTYPMVDASGGTMGRRSSAPEMNNGNIHMGNGSLSSPRFIPPIFSDSNRSSSPTASILMAGQSNSSSMSRHQSEAMRMGSISSQQNSARVSSEIRRGSMGSLPPIKRFHSRGESDISNSMAESVANEPVALSSQISSSNHASARLAHTGKRWSENQSSRHFHSNSVMPHAPSTQLSTSQSMGSNFSAHNRRATMDFGTMNSGMRSNRFSVHTSRSADASSSDTVDSVPVETVRKLLLGQLDPVQLALQILSPEEAAIVARRAAVQETLGIRGLSGQFNLNNMSLALLANNMSGNMSSARSNNRNNDVVNDSTGDVNAALHNRSNVRSSGVRRDGAAQVSDDSVAGEHYRSYSDQSGGSCAVSANTAISSVTAVSASNANMINADEASASSDDCSRRPSNNSSSSFNGGNDHGAVYSDPVSPRVEASLHKTPCSLPKKKRKFVETVSSNNEWM